MVEQAERARTAVGLPRYRWLTAIGVLALAGIATWLVVMATGSLPQNRAIEVGAYLLMLCMYLAPVWLLAKGFLLVQTLLRR